MLCEIKRNALAGVDRTTRTPPARRSRWPWTRTWWHWVRHGAQLLRKSGHLRNARTGHLRLALTPWPQTNAGDRLMRIPSRKPPSTGCRDCMHRGFAEASASASPHGRHRLPILGPATGSGLPIPPESVPGATRWHHQPQTNATSLRHAADQPPNQLARGSRTRCFTISSAATRSSR